MTDATTTDTTTSPSEAPAAETTAAPAATVESQASEAAASDADASVLGGEVADTAAEDTAAEETAPAAVVPEKYELALKNEDGTDFALDADLLAQAEPLLKEAGLTNEQANAILPIAPKIMAKVQDAAIAQVIEAGQTQSREWLEAFRADPDIGGNKVDETTHLAAKGMDALGYTEGHPFRTALTQSGFGNHPDMIRAFRALGQMVGEDGTFVRSGGGTSNAAPGWDSRYKE